MTKRSFLARVKKLGYGPHIIDNADTQDPKIVKLGCELINDDDLKIPGCYYEQHLYGAWGIAQDLHDLADEAGTYWEWENPAIITCYL